MKHLLRALLVAWLLPAPASAMAADLVLDPAGSYIIDARVNGHALRLRVDPAAPGSIVLNPRAAAAAGLRGSMVRAAALIGPVRLKGSSSATNVVIAGTSRRQRLIWFNRDVIAGADGLISPADLPYETVTFRLAPQRPGERSFALDLGPNQDRSLVHVTILGGTPLVVALSLMDEASIATASAGALIAQLQGGAWAGEPSHRPIRFGVERPVRRMALERPLALGGLAIADFLVRTADHRGNYELPADAADPDEIVVTGQGRKQSARLWLEIARDHLAGCSSLTYVRQPQHFELSCASWGKPVSSAERR